MSTPIKAKDFQHLYAAGISTPARLQIMSAMCNLTSEGESPFTINQIFEQKKDIGKIMHRSTITETLAKFRKLDKPLVKVVGDVAGMTRPHFLFVLTPHGKRMAEVLGW
tara:strand:- start:971 stop:1297 length:327 start_codon:yes stop_codon:yes gene_type:complete